MRTLVLMNKCLLIIVIGVHYLYLSYDHLFIQLTYYLVFISYARDMHILRMLYNRVI